MFSPGTVAALLRCTCPDQRDRAAELEPHAREAARCLILAADAMTGPDPEAGAMLLVDTLRDLSRDLQLALNRRTRE